MRVLVVTQSSGNPAAAHLQEQFRKHLGQDGPGIATFTTYEKLLMQAQPQAVAVLLPAEVERGLTIVRHLRRITSGSIFVVGPANDSKLILRALQEGAEHYLDVADLEGSVVALASRKRDREDSGAQGRLLGVLACCGGCGASTLAVNLAATLAKDAGCALIDLKAGRGDLGSLLDLRPKFTLIDLCENTARLDRTMFEKMLIRHASGIQLLGAPPQYGDTRRMTTAGVDQALRMACKLFPSVVLDLEDCFHDEQVHAIKQVQHLLLVCRLDFTSLRNARRIQLHLTERQIAPGVIRVVINRFGQPGELPVEEAEDALGTKLTHFVPDDPKTVNFANNIGVPAVVKYPATKVAQSFKQLADTLVPQRK